MDVDPKYEEFKRELAHLINKYSLENYGVDYESANYLGTPDFILADELLHRIWEYNKFADKAFTRNRIIYDYGKASYRVLEEENGKR
jgi:hypothetical protein